MVEAINAKTFSDHHRHYQGSELEYYVNSQQSLSNALNQQSLDKSSDTIFITSDIELDDLDANFFEYYFEFSVPASDALIINVRFPLFFVYQRDRFMLPAFLLVAD